MKEHPILFTGPMVKAILEGRKTQTRRVVKGIAHDSLVYKPSLDPFNQWIFRTPGCQNYSGGAAIVRCPYGKPGDRLWVRETHARIPGMEGMHAPHYMADGPIPSISERHDAGLLKTYPSIHMPRWASRINLEITNIRVERVQEISEGDTEAEGLKLLQGGIKSEFAVLWDSINKSRGFGWTSNPWVWVVEFRRA